MQHCLRFDIAQKQRPEHKANVNFLLVQKRINLVGLMRAYAQAQIHLAAMHQLAVQRRKQVNIQAVDTGNRKIMAFLAARQAVGVLQKRQPAFRYRDKLLALARERNRLPSLVAHYERSAKLLLQGLQAVAHGRLRQIQLIRRLGNRACAHYSQKRTYCL